MAFYLVCCPTCGDVWARDIGVAGPLPVGARSHPDCVFTSYPPRSHKAASQRVFVVDVLPGDFYARDGNVWERVRNPFARPDDLEAVRYHALAVLFAAANSQE